MEGYSRLIYEKGTGKILGGHILGPYASELIGQIGIAIRSGMTVRDLQYMLVFHPALSENIQRLLFFSEDRLNIIPEIRRRKNFKFFQTIPEKNINMCTPFSHLPLSS